MRQNVRDALNYLNCTAFKLDALTPRRPNLSFSLLSKR